MAEEKKEQVKLQKKDLVKHWLLGYSSETCYNYERLQALGTTNAMVPIVRRLYKTKEEQAKALKKYTVFFNTEPSWIGTVIHGVAASMEEQAANGADIDAEDINAVRIFEIAYKILMLGMGYAMYMMGYKQGKSAILKILSAGTLNKITEIFSIVGLMVVGNMAATRVTIKTPIAFKIGQVAINFQNILDSLLPGMLPLLATLLNKKVKATYIIVILFVVGIIASLTGILAVAS